MLGYGVFRFVSGLVGVYMVCVWDFCCLVGFGISGFCWIFGILNLFSCFGVLLILAFVRFWVLFGLLFWLLCWVMILVVNIRLLCWGVVGVVFLC